MIKNNNKVKTVAEYAASLETAALITEIANNSVTSSSSLNDELYTHILNNELKGRNQ